MSEREMAPDKNLISCSIENIITAPHVPVWCTGLLDPLNQFLELLQIFVAAKVIMGHKNIWLP